ncbi:16S rRNA pseudouridine(516) synthase [Ruminococcaceae bacterium OttesenSCG-928-L11]|nr:16S rRNA pseudouridine(516) synthase [Ruminococcaceae bacterium OttesenSCG-928-L11]
MGKKQAKEQERLDKWVASRSAHSRREIRDMIRAGAITVNGVPASGPEQKVSGADVLLVQGRQLEGGKYIYLMMNKPAGVICATKDATEATVLDLVPEPLWRPGLFPAGRLDKDTEGFVLLTDDGDFAHRILSPTRHVPKRYYAKLDGAIAEGQMTAAFEEGLALGGGDVCLPARLEVVRAEAPAEAYVTIEEGMYHQIKRMFRQFDLTVTYLKRLSIGNLQLDPALAPGECRIILHNDVEAIW